MIAASQRASMSGASSRGGRGASVRRLTAEAIGEDAQNGRTLVAILYITSPSA